MFEELFERPHALARQRSGPIPEKRLSYLRHLADQQMSRGVRRLAAYYLLAICDTLRLADRPDEKIGVAEIEENAASWARGRSRSRRGGAQCCSHSRGRFRWHAKQWLRFLGRLDEPQTPLAPCGDLVAAFAEHLRSERGLSPRTVEHQHWTVQDFLRRLGASADSLPEITITEIDAAFAAKIGDSQLARVSARSYASTLRGFFRYAESRGWCRSGVSVAIKAPHVYAHEGLPVGPSWDDVQRLLATTEGDRPTDIRDRAILLLLAVYGLRSGEVVWLRLEDLNWKQEVLTVRRSKSHEVHTYPLSRTVGDAVLRYLQEVRPRAVHREVFLTRRAPFRPLRSGLWRIVARRLRPLGVSLSHHGPHALRHACATHLLRQGLSLKEIGDYLGHRDPEATRIYTKVDLDGLRQIGEFDLGDLL